MIQRAATPDDRLRLLRDCGPVKGPDDCEAFRRLCLFGLAERVRQDGPLMVYRLTEAGRQLCRRLGPFR